MALRTSIASGPWSSSSTWDTGVPGNADTVSIGHAITVPFGSTIVGTSPAAGTTDYAIRFTGAGSLTIDAGAILKVRGDIYTYGAGAITGQAGSTFEFDSSQAADPTGTSYYCRIGGPINFNGTSGSRCTVRSNAGGGNGRFLCFGDLANTFVATYTDFLRIGDVATEAIKYYLQASVSTLRLDHCVTTSCGQVFYRDTQGDSVVRIEDCRFNAATGALCLFGDTTIAKSTGTRTFLRNVVMHDHQMSLWDYTLDDNYYHVTGNFTAGRSALFRGGFSRIVVNNSSAVHYGNVLDSYYFSEYPSNPHFLQVAGDADLTIDGAVFEHSGSDGQGDGVVGYLGTGTSGDPIYTCTVKRSIVLPNLGNQHAGTVVTGGGYFTTGYSVEHNTGCAGVEPPFAFGESNPGFTGQVQSLKSNIGWRSAAVAGPACFLSNCAAAGQSTTDLLPAANATNNNSFGLLAGSNGKGYDNYLFSSGSPGTNDLAVDPQFVDPTRNLAKWDLSLGGPGTVAAALARLQADPTLTRLSLIPYDREGFRPTNEALRGAAHDGTDIGAVPMAPPGGPATSYTLTGPATATINVASGTFTITMNGTFTGTVTPSAGAGGGTFSPASLTWSGTSDAKTFTYTPASIGVKSISTTNSGSLMNPAAVACTVTLAYGLDVIGFDAAIPWPRIAPNVYPANRFAVTNGADHYDLPRIGTQVGDYTGDSYWKEVLVPAAVDRLREQYVFASGGSVTGYHAWSTGLRMHYERTGDARSRDAALLVAAFAAYNQDDARIWFLETQATSRECAFAIANNLESEALGAAARAMLADRVAIAKGHIDQWTAAPGTRSWATFVRPFMVSLTCESLILAWDRGRDATIPPKIKQAIDWIWTNCWVPAGTTDYIEYGGSQTWSLGAFKYTDASVIGGRFTPIVSAVAAGVTPSTTTFKGGSSLSSQDDFYKYAYVQFTAGAAAAGAAYCTGYVGATRTFTFDPAKRPLAATPAVGDAFQIQDGEYGPTDTSEYEAINGGHGGTGLAPALSLLIAPIYAWYYAFSGDTAYRTKHDAIFAGSAAAQGLGGIGTQKEWNQSYRLSFQGLKWRDQGITPWPAATALTWTGPDTAGRINAMSDRFRVALAGTNRSAATPVVVTFSDAGAGGAFFPATATLTTDRPSAVFRYRPASSGAKSIGITNSGGLTNPASVTYTPVGTAAVATAHTRTLMASSGLAGTEVGVTLALSVTSAVPPTTADARGGLVVIDLGSTPDGRYQVPGVVAMVAPGTLIGNMPRTYRGWLSGDSPSLDLKYLPATAGAKSLTAADDAGLADPAAATFTATAPAAPPPPSSSVYLIAAGGQTYAYQVA